MILEPEISAAMEVLVFLNAAPTYPPKPDKALVVGADREPREMIVPRADSVTEERRVVRFGAHGYAAFSATSCSSALFTTGLMGNCPFSQRQTVERFTPSALAKAVLVIAKDLRASRIGLSICMRVIYAHRISLSIPIA